MAKAAITARHRLAIAKMGAQEAPQRSLLRQKSRWWRRGRIEIVFFFPKRLLRQEKMQIN